MIEEDVIDPSLVGTTADPELADKLHPGKNPQ